MTYCRTHWYGGFLAFRDLELSALGAYALAVSVFVLPAALLLGFRRTLGPWALMVSLICSASVLFAESWAGLEEALWRREAPTSENPPTVNLIHVGDLGGRMLQDEYETVSKSRWWPFEHHCLWYQPESKRFGGHD
jgi:hypothetical protein